MEIVLIGNFSFETSLLRLNLIELNFAKESSWKLFHPVGPVETEFKNGKHKGTKFIHSKLMKIIFINNISSDCVFNWRETNYSSSFLDKPMRKKFLVFKSMKPKSMTKIVRILISLPKMHKKHFVGEKSMETTLIAASSQASNVLHWNSRVITFIDEITKNIDFFYNKNFGNQFF